MLLSFEKLTLTCSLRMADTFGKTNPKALCFRNSRSGLHGSHDYAASSTKLTGGLNLATCRQGALHLDRDLPAVLPDSLERIPGLRSQEVMPCADSSWLTSIPTSSTVRGSSAFRLTRALQLWIMQARCLIPVAGR